MRFFRDLAITIASLIASLLLLEAGLRIAGVRYSASLYTRERERGYALRPGAEGWHVTENENYIRINRDGNRDLDRAVDAPGGTLRIAFIGSSETEGEEVSLENTFEAVIERELRKAGPSHWSNVEVMNFGVAGYGMSQEYLTLRDHVWRYHPQIVVLATTAFVVLTNTRELYPFPDQSAPFFDYRDGVLGPDDQTRAAPPLDPRRLQQKNRLSDWMNQSYLLLMLNEARSNAPLVFHDLIQHWRFGAKRVTGSAPGAPPPNYQSTWPYLPDLPAMQKSWQIADGFLDLMKGDCDAHGAEFWLVTLDMEMQVDPDPAEREAFRQHLGLPSLYESDKRLTAMASAKSIHTMMLAPVLADYSATHHIALHGFFNTKFNDGHWNELGHQIAGQAIARELRRSSPVIQARDNSALSPTAPN
jgi:hypothetical protein